VVRFEPYLDRILKSFVNTGLGFTFLFSSNIMLHCISFALS